MTDHTTMSKVSRLEVIETGARRRWTLEEKRRIVSESHDGRRQVSATARRNGLSASQLFTWRRLAREGRLVEVDNGAMFAQAVISCEPSTSGRPSFPEHIEPPENSPSSSCPVEASGRMEIVLTGGRRGVGEHGGGAAALARGVGDPGRERRSWRWSSIFLSGVNDPLSERRARLVGDRPHRYEEGLPEPGIVGSGDAQARSAQRAPVRVSWPAR